MAANASPLSPEIRGVNVKPGIGMLGRVARFGPESGVFLGGLWSGDATTYSVAAVDPKSWNLNSLMMVWMDLTLRS